MILLTLSILGSSAIYALFKLFPRFGIQTFPAIVANYVVAASLGFAVAASSGAGTVIDTSWIPYALGIGALFITLFRLMARSSQLFGVGVTGLSTKMSLLIPVIIFILFDPEESATLPKMTGIALGLFAVYLSTSRTKKDEIPSTDDARNKMAWLPFVVFAGSGVLDLILATTEKYVLKTPAAATSFTPLPFSVAGVIGILVLAYLRLAGKGTIRLKDLLAGIILGVVNYGSIYFLLRFLGSGWLDRSAAIPVNNIGVVILSALIGLAFFAERPTPRKVWGLFLAVISILVLAFLA